MKNRFSVLFALMAMLAMHSAQAGGISDVGVNSYWGADGHGYNDVIGSSTYDISGATITRVGSVLTVTIATNFASNAGIAPGSAPGGIGYGDVFLAKTWNPFGTAADTHHLADNASNGTLWSYGFNLDNRWSNSGGKFTLYKLNGATNAANVLTSDSFMSCATGTQCYYRNGQAVAVNTATSNSANVYNTQLTGDWTVSAGLLTFKINVATSELLNFSSFAMHWGETCQNDVIEGATNVPLPGSLPLLGLGLGAMLVLRRRQAGLNAYT